MWAKGRRAGRATRRFMPRWRHAFLPSACTRSPSSTTAMTRCISVGALASEERVWKHGGVPNELISNSDSSPICKAIDEEANHQIMHLDGFGKTAPFKTGQK